MNKSTKAGYLLQARVIPNIYTHTDSYIHLAVGVHVPTYFMLKPCDAGSHKLSDSWPKYTYAIKLLGSGCTPGHFVELPFPRAPVT